MKKMEEVEAEAKALERILGWPKCLSAWGKDYWASNMLMLNMIRAHFQSKDPESATSQGAIDALKWFLEEEEEDVQV